MDSTLECRSERRRLAHLLARWLSRRSHGMRRSLQMWRSGDRDRAYFANLTGAELEHLSRDLGRPAAELQAEARKALWR